MLQHLFLVKTWDYKAMLVIKESMVHMPSRQKYEEIPKNTLFFDKIFLAKTNLSSRPNNFFIDSVSQNAKPWTTNKHADTYQGYAISLIKLAFTAFLHIATQQQTAQSK